MKYYANLLFEVSTLRKIARSHRAVLLSDDLTDNISSHSFLVTWVALLIAKKEKANVERVLTMAILHDVPETRTGDIAWINKRYVKDFEDEAINDLFPTELELDDLKQLLTEYHKRESLEAQIVKDADKIAQFICLKEYIFAYDNQQAREWCDVKENWYESFFTKTGRDLAQAVRDTKVNDWARGVRTEKRRT